MYMDNNLELMIKRSGLQKKVLAERKGITPETLSRHIHGKIQLTLNDAEEYADYLGCSAQEIMFRTEAIDIVAYSVTSANGNKSESFLPGEDAKYPKGKVWLNDHYQHNVGAVIYDIHKDYVGPWIQYRNGLGIVLCDPIDQGIVSKDCVENCSYAKIKDGKIMFGYVYPEPRGTYAIYNPWADSDFFDQKSFLENAEPITSGLKLEWATPLISMVWRPDLRGVIIETEGA